MNFWDSRTTSVGRSGQPDAELPKERDGSTFIAVTMPKLASLLGALVAPNCVRYSFVRSVVCGDFSASLTEWAALTTQTHED